MHVCGVTQHHLTSYTASWRVLLLHLHAQTTDTAHANSYSQHAHHTLTVERKKRVWPKPPQLWRLQRLLQTECRWLLEVEGVSHETHAPATSALDCCSPKYSCPRHDHPAAGAAGLALSHARPGSGTTQLRPAAATAQHAEQHRRHMWTHDLI